MSTGPGSQARAFLLYFVRLIRFNFCMDTLELILVAAACVAVAGAIKGFVGLGFPTAALGLLTLTLPPRVAISMILLPMLVSNVWQLFRAGEVRETIRRHWRFALVLAIGVSLTSYLSQGVDDRLLLALLGVAILLFVLLSWCDAVPRIPPHRLRLIEGISAVLSAILGGLTAAWAAPMTAYLVALRLSPVEFLRATGFLIAVGSFPLCATFLGLGYMTPRQATLSAALVLPTLLGFYLGERLRKRASPAQFRNGLLWVFLGLGLNLLYRAL